MYEESRQCRFNLNAENNDDAGQSASADNRTVMICDKPRDRISLQSAQVKTSENGTVTICDKSVGEDWAMQGQQRVKNSKVQSTANAALQR